MDILDLSLKSPPYASYRIVGVRQTEDHSLNRVRRRKGGKIEIQVRYGELGGGQ